MNKKHKYTPLEALDILHFNCDYYPNKDKHWEIIHTALKDYEHLQETRYVILGGRCSGKNYKVNILLKLKALEIIKKKNIDVQLLESCQSLKEYNWCVHTKYRALTQQEYDLLKEVLL